MIELLDDSDIDKIKVFNSLYFLNNNYHAAQAIENIEIFRIFCDCIKNKSLNFKEEIGKQIDAFAHEKKSPRHLVNYFDLLLNQDKEEVFNCIEGEEVQNVSSIYNTIHSTASLDQGIYALLIQILIGRIIDKKQVKGFINNVLSHCSMGFLLEEKNYDNLDKVANYIDLIMGGELSEDMLDALVDNGVYLNTVDHSGNNYTHELAQTWANPALICYLHNRFYLDVNAKNEEGQSTRTYVASNFSQKETEQIISKSYFSDTENLTNDIKIQDNIIKSRELVKKDSLCMHLIEEFREKRYGLVDKIHLLPIERAYYCTHLSDNEYLEQFEKSTSPFELYRGHNFLTLCLLQKRNDVLSLLLKNKDTQEYIEKEMTNFPYFMVKKCTEFMKMFKENEYLLKVKNSDGNNIFNQLAKTYHIEALIELLKLNSTHCEKNNKGVGILDYISKNTNIEEKNQLLFTSLIENAMIKGTIKNDNIVDKKKFKI